MKVNHSCPLVLVDLYLYDFEACYWNILDRLNYDLSGIEFEDKLKRNIEIGKIQKKNPVLASYLYQTTDDLVDEFLVRNEVQDHELIVRQRDGVILTRPLVYNKMGGIEFKRRNLIDFIIISKDRRKILYLENETKKVTVKGVPFVYESILEYYQKFSTLNFSDKKALCIQLQSIKDGLEKQSPKFFCIPNSDNSVSVFLISEGQVVLSQRSIRLVSKKSIDLDRYFDHYFRPFTESIFLELLTRGR